MTTPNEELINNLTIKAGVMEMGEKIAWGSDTALMRQAAAALQSQAERIAELERESETHSKAYGLAIVERDNLRHELKVAQEGWRCECSTDDACRFARERDALRAQLEAIAATEPVAWMVQFSPGSRWVELTKEEFDSDLDGHIVYKKQAFFTRPMPAQPADHEVRELVNRLTAIAKEFNVAQQLRERIANEIRPFTLVMPAQDVTELVEALQLFADALPLDKSTIKTCYAVTDQMRDAAHAALSKYKGAKQ